jgi:hypothetical protein
MRKSKSKTLPKPDPGEWEPMMLVISLAMAAWLAFLLYGDRMPLAAKATSTSVAILAPVQSYEIVEAARQRESVSNEDSRVR